MATVASNAGVEDALWFVRQARAPRLRSMREFAEAEIIIPDGPFQGSRFRVERQPFTRLWMDEVNSGRWRRFVSTGPVQSGKSLLCFVIPILYHLFEVGETVICGLPDMDMASDKWYSDILPVIERCRYRELLPRTGAGSRGGKVESIRFVNGAVLKFMSGAGGDKSRAGFTSRVLVITETDGMDEASKTSRESDPITQLEARTQAYGSRARIYMECTVSIAEGRTWKEFTGGTESRIVVPCQKCGVWVTPGRDDLVGWQGAESLMAARRSTYFYCSACGEQWSEADRLRSNLAGVLVHKGQEIDADGVIHGDPPETDTLGFRWSAPNNQFLTAADFGEKEWRASKAEDDNNAEMEMRQYVWALPHEPSSWKTMPIDCDVITKRISNTPRGIIPEGTHKFTVGLDLGDHVGWWLAVAWFADGSSQVVEYDRLAIASDLMGVERAVLATLREFRAVCDAGWPDKDQRRVPDQVFIDSGHGGHTQAVYAFVRETTGNRYRPSKGYGVGQHQQNWYSKPKGTGAVVVAIGEEYHIARQPKDGVHLVEVNADYWKSWTHRRLSTPVGTPGAMVLHKAPPQDHITLGKHLTAEEETQEAVAGKGIVTKWVRKRANNHWFDALYNACAAGHLAGARLVEGIAVAAEPKRHRAVVSAGSGRPDGRSWI